MTKLVQCPSSEQWKCLLDDSLPASEQAALHTHLAQCGCCSDLVTGLATDADSEASLTSRLADRQVRPVPDAELLRVMSAVKAQLIFPTTHGESGMPAEVILDFLSASANSDHLGRLGPYEIVEVVGRGGMGLVLKGHDLRLNRFVAVKVLAPQLAASATARARFRREGQAAAAVTHDHVIAIHAVDEANGLPYLVMEYVAGRSLDQRIESTGPLQLKEILRIGMQAAQGLAAAHAQGLVHRDIKPANILLENGVERVKITDFGLARAVDDVRITRPGVLTGTPEYMSPEQARGESVDHRSDLFSLGCVLYAMCTGRPPFRAENTVAQVRRICEDTPRPIAEVNPEIPDWLADIIDRLLAKSPDDRFQSAGEVGELLAAHLAHLQQPSAHPQPPRLDTRPWAVRRENRISNRSRPWAISAAIVLLLAAGLALAESTGVTNVAATVIRIVQGDGTLVVEVDDPNIQVLVDGEELVISGAGPKEIRLRPGQHELKTLKDGRPSDTKLVTISRDGRQVVRVAREAPPATVQSVPTTRLVWEKAEDVYGLSPAGRYLSFIDWETGDVAIRDLTTGKNRRVTNKGSWQESTEFGLWPRISPDSKELVYTWFDKLNQTDLRVIGMEGGEPRVVYSGKNELVSSEACGWMPDGKQILAKLHLKHTSGDRQLGRSQLVLIATANGSVRILKEYSGNSGLGAAALAPDGRTLAYSRIMETSTFKQDIFLLDIETGQDTPVERHAADKRILAWTPDGQHLLFDMERQQARDAWMIRVAGGKPQGEAKLVKKDLGHISPLGITHDGAFYYGSSSKGTTLYTAELDVDQGAVAATPLAAEKYNLMDHLALGDWSPDGEYLVYWARRPLPSQATLEFRKFSIKTGQVQVLKQDLTFIQARMRWSPDGRYILASGAGNVAAATGPQPGIFQVDAVSGQAKNLMEGRGVLRPVWSRDGQGIFYSRMPSLLGQLIPNPLARNMPIVFRDLATNAEKEVFTPGNPDFDGKLGFWFEPSPDGRQLALLGKPSDESLVLWLIPVEGGASRELFRVNAPGISPGGLAWTPDGRFVLFTQLGGEESQRGLWIASASGGHPRQVTLTGMDAKTLTRFAMHPDGKKLALTSQGTGKSEVWALENFLPPLADSITAAARSAATAPAATVARERPAHAGPNNRLVWADAVDPEFAGAPSPDGKYVCYTDWSSGDVAVRELVTGTSRRLSNQGYPEHARSSVFAPDSQRVAYGWRNRNGVHELRMIGLDGSEPRVLYPNEGKEVEYLELSGWSSDGQYLLASFFKQGGFQIVLVSTVDGSVRVLKTVGRGSPGKMALSPDGKYVAYSAYPEKNSSRRDIFLLATDGGSEVPLVEHAADDFVLGWAPDGKRVLFASDRTGAIGIWSVGVAEGKPRQTPVLLKAEMAQFHAVGLTQAGSLFYGVFSGAQNVYTAQIDLEQGKLLAKPVVAIERTEGSNWAPAWSPDGRYLACEVCRRGRDSVFHVRSFETNEVRELAPNLRHFDSHSLHWSGDGRALLGSGENAEWERGLLRIDANTGAVTTLVGSDSRVPASYPLYPLPDSNGKALFYTRVGPLLRNDTHRICRWDLQDGNEQELYRTPSEVSWLTLSPDGQQLAFAEQGALKLMPATGGEPREIVNGMKGDGHISTIAWTPDGRNLLYQSVIPASEGGAARPTLWRLQMAGGEPERLDVDLPELEHLRIHSDGRQIAFTARLQPDKIELWALENFLPPTGDPKPDTAGGSAVKTQ